MGQTRMDEFRKDAVRIALSSKDQDLIRGIKFPEDGLTRKQIASDLGVGMSTLNKWITAHRDTDVVSVEDLELARENERLRRENRILKEERDILKKATQFIACYGGQERHWSERLPDTVSFRFVEEHKEAFATDRLCQVMNVSPRGLRAFRSRPASRRQRTDMVVLAQIKEQLRLSLGSYGRPRMTEELQEVGANVGHRRVGWLLRENGITVERTHKFKATTDSNHTCNIAPNLLEQNFIAEKPNQKWAGDISYTWTCEGWLCLALAARHYF